MTRASRVSGARPAPSTSTMRPRAMVMLAPGTGRGPTQSITVAFVSTVRIAPILPERAGQVKPAIALKTSVTERKGVASKPVLPTTSERSPRDRAHAPGIRRGDAPPISTGRQAGARTPTRRVLPHHGVSSQSGDPPVAGRPQPAGSGPGPPRPLRRPGAGADPRAGVARQRSALRQAAPPDSPRAADGPGDAPRRRHDAGGAGRAHRRQRGHSGPAAAPAAPAPPASASAPRPGPRVPARPGAAAHVE